VYDHWLVVVSDDGIRFRNIYMKIDAKIETEYPVLKVASCSNHFYICDKHNVYRYSK